jgi:hypothetical protein
MTVKEAKEIIESRKSQRRKEIVRLITTDISHVILGLEQGKIELYEAIYRIKSIMKEVNEADIDIGEYWRVLDTLEWLED